MKTDAFEIEDALSLTTGGFLRLLFNRCNTGFVEIAYIAPEGTRLYPRVVTQFRPLPVGMPDDYPRSIMNRNAQGYGAYVGVTVSGVSHPPETRVSDQGREYTVYPRRKKADVTLAPALWVDIDGVTLQEGCERLMCAPLPPSIIVRSGGGCHGYWLLNQPARINAKTREDFELTLRAFARATGGDEQTCEVARVMRLPGTINTKPGRAGAMCEVIDCIPVYYDYEMVRYELRAFMPRPAVHTVRNVPMEAVDPQLPKYVNDFLQHGAPAGKRNHTLYVCASFYRDHGKSQMEAENDLAPVVTSGDFSHEEAMRTISSAYSEGAKPALPRYMSARMAMGDRR